MAFDHARLVNRLLQRPYFGLAVAALLLFTGLWGLKSLVIQADYFYFFDESDPNLVAYQSLEQAYSRDDSILIVVSPVQGSIFERDTLDVIARLTEEAWQIPYVKRVDSLSNFLHVRAAKDDLDISPLFGDLDALTDEQLQQRIDSALAEPALVNWLLSPDGRVAAVNASILLPGESATENIDAVTQARKMTARFREQFPELNFYLTGIAMINHGFYEGVLNDLLLLMPIMSLIMVLVLYAALRSVGGVIAVLTVMTFSVVIGVGTATLLKIPVTPPSASAAIVIMTIAIADAIHVVVRVLGLIGTGLAKLPAVEQSLAENARPILLTSLTTLIGFLCLNSSDVPPYRHLGNTVALGVVAAYALTYLLLPGLLRWLPLKAAPSKSFMGEEPGARFGAYTVRRARPLMLASLALVVMTIPLAFLNQINDGFVSYFAENSPIRLDAEYTMEHLTGLYSIQYSLDSGESGGIYEPAYLQSLEAFEAWARGQPEVVHVSSILPTLKRINQSLNPDLEDSYRLPESRSQVAQYLLLYEFSLPPGMELTNQIDLDRRETRMIVFLKNIDNRAIKAFERRAQEWMLTRMKPGMSAPGSGPIMMFADIFERGTISTLKGLALGVVVIAVIIGLALKSPMLGMISLLPNVLPAMVALGFWALLDGTINVAVSSVVAISFGIVVDDTIHLLCKYRQGIENGLGSEEAMIKAFRLTTGALVTTTLVLCVGFSVLAFSDFGLNQTMGLLTALTIIIALYLDFFLLPGLLLITERFHANKN